MAKIYETQNDIERDRNTRAEKSAKDGFFASLIALGVGLVLLGFGLFKKKPAAGITLSKPELGFWKGVWEGFKEGPSLNVLGGVSSLIGITGLFTTKNDGDKAKATLSALGPERIILPGEVTHRSPQELHIIPHNAEKEIASAALVNEYMDELLGDKERDALKHAWEEKIALEKATSALALKQ